MQELLTIFNNPAALRILIAGLLAGGLLGLLGIFVALRNMAFFSDGLAHTALAGLAVGVVLGQEPLWWALLFAVLFAIIIYFLEKKTSLLPDAAIGLLFTAGLALGVLLLHFKSGGSPEDLEGILFGDISRITTLDVSLMAAASVLVGTFILFNFKKYLYLSFNKELAYLSGLKTEFYHLLLYVMLAISIILGIKLLGVILVSALVIIPVSTAKLFARSARGLLAWTIVFAEIAVLLGLFIAFQTGWPAGAVVILSGTLIFFLSLIGSLLRGR